MKTLLRIDASARHRGSHSRALADHFETIWCRANPGGQVLVRDLAVNPPPHLDEATVAIFYAGGDAGPGAAPEGIEWSDILISELNAADEVVVSSAVYNFSLPSALKAWIDHVVRFGHTIAYGAKGVTGLLEGKSVCLLTARGGTPGIGPDYQGPVLEAVFRYIGFATIRRISLEGTMIPDGQLSERIAEVRTDIEKWIEAGEAARQLTGP
jgi:FMN-dependent NADH-azoreductase